MSIAVMNYSEAQDAQYRAELEPIPEDTQIIRRAIDYINLQDEVRACKGK